MKAHKIRWGILGPGAIAREFAQDFQFVENGAITAVASRSIDRAKAFAAQFSIPTAYGSYEELYNDPEIDVIYIATPHNFHFEQSFQAIMAGKPVLCEKPVTTNPDECDRLLKLASEKKNYLMEGMWTYFLPAIRKARTWVDEGRIGKIQHFKSDFGFKADFNPKGRLFNPDLAGGALLDIGIYPIAAAWYFLQENPTAVSVLSRKAPTGVDDYLSIQFDYPDFTAELTASLRCRLPNWSYIIGDEGYIAIPNIWQTRQCTLYQDDQKIDHFADGRESNGFNFEIEAVSRDLLDQKTESLIMPHAFSRKLQEHMNLVREKF